VEAWCEGVDLGGSVGQNEQEAAGDLGGTYVVEKEADDVVDDMARDDVVEVLWQGRDVHGR
jgi:hypothetical protein